MSSLKILSIGNSFSEDAQGYLHHILLSAGIDNLCVDLVIGGCQLKTHATNIKENNRAYILEINDKIAKKPVTLEAYIDLYDWDVITNQQASVLSGVKESYDPYLGEILAYCNEKSPSSRKMFQRTWAYEVDCSIEWFNQYDRDQSKMDACIKDAAETYAKKYNLELIPSGEVINELRKNKYFNYPNGGMSIHRDGFHMNIPYGRYAVGLTWAKVIAGVEPTSVTYIPAGADPEICKSVRETVSEYFKNNK